MQPQGVKSIIRERKLRKVVKWQGAVKQKTRKAKGVKQGLGCIWFSRGCENREQTFSYT